MAITLKEMCDELVTRIKAFCTGHNDLSDDLWSVVYGDQAKLHKRLTICVEPNVKRNTLRNAQRGITREYEVYVLIYYTNLNEGGIFSREWADDFAEQLEMALNVDPSFGGALLHCYVTEVASGYSTKSGSLVKSSRLTFNGETTDRLPS